MKSLLVACAFALATVSTALAQPPAPKGPFGAEEWKHSAIPLRPGEPGKAPFWNAHAPRFIFAPAFNFPKVDGAVRYRFELTSANNSQTYRFEADRPWAPLSPIWASVPVGNFDLKVTGLSAQGAPVGVAGQGKYFRAAPFDGPYLEPLMPYDQSGALALDKAMHKPYVEYWLTHHEPDPGYYYYRYPAKLFGSLIVGAVTHARLKGSTADGKRSAELARIIGDHLIKISFPAGTPLEFFPPAYGGHTVGKNPKSHMQLSNYLIIAATESGQAFLDLYDFTHDRKYLEAAERIAHTYVKTQLPNGSWIAYIDHETGKPTADKLAIPTSTINYLERLQNDYGVKGLSNTIQAAFDWIMENPVQTFEWLAQYEDVGLTRSEPYERMSREQPCDFAIYLFKRRAGDPRMIALAEDLIRFSEDQFISWEQMEDLVVNASKTLRPSVEGVAKPGWYSKNWMLPVVHEQYGFWMPSARNTGLMIETYWAAYIATKKEVYRAKALSIANNFTHVQKEHDGDYPTMFTKYPMNFWINNSIYPARVMMRLQQDLSASRQ
jgi:maltose/maltodextrin transport system substrate-binding protein